MNKYSDDDLLKLILDKYKELGRTPKKREVEKYFTIIERFNTWNKALMKAGLVPLKSDISFDEYKEIIIDWANKNGRPPRQEDFYSNKYLPDPSVVRKKFKMSWSKMLKECGLKVNLHFLDEYNFSDEDLLNIVKIETERIGSNIQKDFEYYRNDTVPGSTYIKEQLNMSWNEILIKCNLPTNKQDLTQSEIIDKIKILADEICHIPSLPELRTLTDITENNVRKKFGTYNELLSQAGLQGNKTPDSVNESNEELVEIYKEFCNKIGKIASALDLNASDEIYNADVFTIRFGGMQNLKKIAGFEVRKSKMKYTKDQLKYLLLEKYRIKGKKLTNSEIYNDNDFPATSTILRYFHTTKMSDVWSEVLK